MKTREVMFGSDAYQRLLSLIWLSAPACPKRVSKLPDRKSGKQILLCTMLKSASRGTAPLLTPNTRLIFIPNGLVLILVISIIQPDNVQAWQLQTLVAHAVDYCVDSCRMVPRAEIEATWAIRCPPYSPPDEPSPQKITAVISRSRATVIFIIKSAMKIALCWQPRNDYRGNALKFYASEE